MSTRRAKANLTKNVSAATTLPRDPDERESSNSGGGSDAESVKTGGVKTRTALKRGKEKADDNATSSNEHDADVTPVSQLAIEISRLAYVKKNSNAPAKERKTRKVVLKYDEDYEDEEHAQDDQDDDDHDRKIKNSSNKNNNKKTTKPKRPETSKTQSNTEDEQDTPDNAHGARTEKRLKGKYDTRRNYEEMLRIVQEFRAQTEAPVDTQGAGCQRDTNEPKEVQDFHTFTSLILSVQTKDETTDAVTRRLIADGWTIDRALKLSDEQLKAKIYEVNFNAKKVQYIKQCAKIFRDDYGGRLPTRYEDLLKLPGVGPKVASLYMQIAEGQITGIAVDTHVHRISNRFEWVNTKTPEQTKVALEKLVDRKYWGEVNGALVGLGQTICRPINPLCHECVLQDKCPEGRRRRVGRQKV